MAVRRLSVLLIAFLVAGGTAWFAKNWIAQQQAARSAVATAPSRAAHAEILVAAVDLPAGMFVKEEHLRWQSWPSDDVPDSYLLMGKREQAELIGAVVRQRIPAGQPLTDGGVVKPGDRGFLAAVLAPGTRAVSVPINATSGNSGLIFPGDRVDLILTQTLQAEDGGTTRRVSETVLENIRIIAMGVATDDAAKEGRNYEKAKTATLEVTPRQAESVALVTELGKLSLSLRSLASSAPVELVAAQPGEVTWDRDVSQVLQSGRGPNGKLMVLRGSKAEDVQVEGSNQ